MIELFETKYLTKPIEIPNFIREFHEKEFKVTDIVHNDLYRHLNDGGLFDYNYIQRGTKGYNNPSKTNLVFLTWLMMVKDLRDFGFVKQKLHRVKDYLFEEFDVLESFGFPVDKKSLLVKLEKYEFDNEETKNKFEQMINSGEFITRLKDVKVSRLFLTIFKLIMTGRDLQLYIDSNGETIVIDDFNLSEEELQQLSYESRIVLPLKNYLLYFVGEYAPIEFLTRSNIVTEKEAILLQEFRRNDIISMTVKYHNGDAHMYEIREYKKLKIQNRLTNLFLKKGYEDIVIRTNNGRIYYSEITTRIKFDKK